MPPNSPDHNAELLSLLISRVVRRSVGKREPTEVNCMLRTRFRCRRTPYPPPLPFFPFSQALLARCRSLALSSALGISFGVGCSLTPSVRARNYQIQTAAAEANAVRTSECRWYLAQATIPSRVCKPVRPFCRSRSLESHRAPTTVRSFLRGISPPAQRRQLLDAP